MKRLLGLAFASVLLFASLTACAKENTTAAVVEEPKTKQVCIDTKGKDGKVVKQCKTVKVHKKFEGTKVPEKSKK